MAGFRNANTIQLCTPVVTKGVCHSSRWVWHCQRLQSSPYEWNRYTMVERDLETARWKGEMEFKGHFRTAGSSNSDLASVCCSLEWPGPREVSCHTDDAGRLIYKDVDTGSRGPSKSYMPSMPSVIVSEASCHTDEQTSCNNDQDVSQPSKGTHRKKYPPHVFTVYARVAAT
jgi:hypothetical protein